MVVTSSWACCYLLVELDQLLERAERRRAGGQAEHEVSARAGRERVDAFADIFGRPGGHIGRVVLDDQLHGVACRLLAVVVASKETRRTEIS